MKVAVVHAVAGRIPKAPKQQRFLRFVEEVMLRYNDYRVTQATIAQWLTALRTGE